MPVDRGCFPPTLQGVETAQIMNETITIYALLDAARRALEAQDAATAQHLTEIALGRQPDHLEAHHLAGLAVYFAACGAATPAVPIGYYKLTTQSGALHLNVGLTLEKLGHQELALGAFRTAALLDFHLQPELRAGFGGPFNGQVLRAATFRAIAARGALAEVIETGTFRGTTAEYMTRHVECPVKSTELNPYFFEFARLRFEELVRLGSSGARNFQLFARDSRAFLTDLFAAAPPDRGISFFYLDAHGEYIVGHDMPNPLVEELTLIRRARAHCIVMIDDFNVPDDSAYYVDQGITIEDVAAVLPHFHAWFFPLSSRHDTGHLRGSLVLSGSAETTALLDGVAELRRA
jgi:hypothetical protein